MKTKSKTVYILKTKWVEIKMKIMDYQNIYLFIEEIFELGENTKKN